MLALTRRTNESIILGDDIKITVLEIKGDQVRIGIEAPKSVPIYREELYIQIQESNKEAASSKEANTIESIGKIKGLFK